MNNNSDKKFGKIIVLNGVPRSGKSSIANILQSNYGGTWVNLGVDNYMKIIPQQLQPGIGLRPGGEKPELEPYVKEFYSALFESIATHSRLGINVVADLGLHENYANQLNILDQLKTSLNCLPVTFVGVHAPIKTIMERRIKTWNQNLEKDGSIPAIIYLWQESVHKDKKYDVEVDTSKNTSEECAELIQKFVLSQTNVSSLFDN